MPPSVIDLSCPGCGAPISSGDKTCEYCDRPLVISSFNNLLNLDSIQTNKYQQTYRTILANDPTNPDVKKALGLTLIKLGLYDQAIQMLDEASLYNINDADSCFFSAVARLRGKRPALIKRKEIDEIIGKVEAASLIEPKAIYEFFLSVVKFDHHRRKCYNISPNYRDHLINSKEMGVSDNDISDLETIMKFTVESLPAIEEE